MCVDRAGIVGQDGETHQGLLDLAFFNIVPNLTVISPKDFRELEQMLDYANTYNKPIVIRYPRGSESSDVKFNTHEPITEGKAEIIQENENSKIVIIAIGKMVARAVQIANILREKRIETDIINARFLNIEDYETYFKYINKSKKVVTIEDGIKIGGLGSNVQNFILCNNLKNVNLKIFGYPKKFIEHGTVEQLEKKYKLDKDSIAESILDWIK